MDPILQVLLSWQFVFFGLAVATVMYVFRLIVEYLASVAKKDLTASNLWNHLVLPIMPIILGVVAAILLKTFPYPGFTPTAAGIVQRGDRIIFGLVAGTFSTLMYRTIKALFYQKIANFAQGFSGNRNRNANVDSDQDVPTEQIPPEHLPTRGQV
jgi:hypothetical protein